jgi:hypothetical protein
VKFLCSIILLFSIPCYCAEVKAEGQVYVRIVEQEDFNLVSEENLMDAPYVIVYTKQGATVQIVF